MYYVEDKPFYDIDEYTNKYGYTDLAIKKFLVQSLLLNIILIAMMPLMILECCIINIFIKGEIISSLILTSILIGSTVSLTGICAIPIIIYRAMSTRKLIKDFYINK